MNLWIALIISITVLQSSEIDSIFNEADKWRTIKKELENLKTDCEKSEVWKSNYESDLRLYTAGIDEHSDTCTRHIFECYCEEFKVVVEEMNLSGESNIADNMSNTLDLMKSVLSESDMTGSCKKCEEYEEKSFQEFFKSFESLAQKMNAHK